MTLLITKLQGSSDIQEAQTILLSGCHLLIMPNLQMAVDAPHAGGVFKVIDVRVYTLAGQIFTKKVAVAAAAGGVEGIVYGILQPGFGLPVDAFDVFEQRAIGVANAQTSFFPEIGPALRRKVAFHTMGDHSALIFEMS